MPRQYRLSRAQFELLQRLKPTRVQGRFFSLAAYFNVEHLPGTKIGFIVPKKIVPRANTRNTIERRGREIVRKLLKNNPFEGVFVFNSKKGIHEASYKDLQTDITSLFEQAH